MLRILVDVTDKPVLLFIERTLDFFFEQLGEAGDGMERRSQFVAHPAQEFAFEAIGPLHFFVARLQFAILSGQFFGISGLYGAQPFFRLPPLTDVADDRRYAEAFFELDRAETDFHGNRGSVFSLPHQLQPDSHGASSRVGPVPVAMRLVPGANCLRDQYFHWP